MKRFTIAVSALFGALLAPHTRTARAATDVEQRQHPLVYGADSRTEAAWHPDPRLRELAMTRSMALVKKDALVLTADGVSFVAPSLSDALDVCSSGPFADPPLLAECSGVLLTDEVVVTAGHCVADLEECESVYFVLGYALDASGDVRLDPRDVFKCRQVLAREVSPFQEATLFDHAFIELDRPVAAVAAPIRVRRDAVTPGEPVLLIGNALGIPTKIDDAAMVVEARTEAQDYFTAGIDNFHRGSGSGVFDAELRLVGIAVRGGVDFEGSTECLSARHVSAASPHAEEISYVSTALARSGLDSLVADGRLGQGCSQSPAGPGPAGWSPALALVLLARRKTRVRPSPQRRAQQETVR